MKHESRQKRKQDVLNRVSKTDHMYSYCRIIGCPCTATAGTNKGLNRLYCRKHEEHFERHGSYTKRSYRASEINPYRRAAYDWLTENQDKPYVKHAMEGMKGLYRKAGPLVEAFRLRGKKPEERARATWARLREKRVDPRIPLAAWLAVEMIFLDDPQPELKREYKLVQAAKIIHRLAGGTHKRWEHVRSDGTVFIEELHKYPASRGRVLRHIGEQLEKVAELVVEHHLDDIKALRLNLNKKIEI